MHWKDGFELHFSSSCESFFTFFAWRHQVLVGFQDVCERFLDVLLFHAGQNRWRQKLRQTPTPFYKDTAGNKSVHAEFICSSHLKKTCRAKPQSLSFFGKNTRLGRTVELLPSIKHMCQSCKIKIIGVHFFVDLTSNFWVKNVLLFFFCVQGRFFSIKDQKAPEKSTVFSVLIWIFITFY